MPRASNYSAVSFYKIVCNDPAIVDFYVGSTTNLVKRRCDHKSNCKSGNTAYVYEFIREHGNWINWTVLEICNKTCIDKSDMLRTERGYIEDLKATLNKVRPIVSIEEARETHAITNAKYYQDNKDQIAITTTKYYQDNKDQIAITTAKYYQDNKDHIAITTAKYYQDNKDHINQLRRDRRLKNKSSI